MHIPTLLLALAATALALPQPRDYFHPDRPLFNKAPHHPGRPIAHHISEPNATAASSFTTETISAHPTHFPFSFPLPTATAAPFTNSTTNGGTTANVTLPLPSGTGIFARPTGIISPPPSNWTGPWHGGQPHSGHGHGGHTFGHPRGKGRGKGRGGKDHNERNGREQMHDALGFGGGKHEVTPGRTRGKGKYVPKAAAK